MKERYKLTDDQYPGMIKSGMILRYL